MKTIRESGRLHHSETPPAYSKMQMECMMAKGKRVRKLAERLLKLI